MNVIFCKSNTRIEDTLARHCKTMDPDPTMARLMEAVKELNQDKMLEIIRSGVNVNYRDALGQSIVEHVRQEYYSSKNRLQHFEFLFKMGVNPNEILVTGSPHVVWESLIFDAVSWSEGRYYSNLGLLQLLLKYGANPNARNSSGNTPLHRACSNGYFAIVRLLVKSRANINAVNENSKYQTIRTPIDIAEQYCNTNIVQYLVAMNEQIKSRRCAAIAICGIRSRFFDHFGRGLKVTQPTIGILPKDILRCIGRMVWESRFNDEKIYENLCNESGDSNG